MADSDELQRAREQVAMLERKQELMTRREKAQRELEQVDSELRDLSQGVQMSDTAAGRG